MRTISIRLDQHAYPIFVGDIAGSPEALTVLASIVHDRSCLLVTDTHVAGLYLNAACEMLEHAGAAHIATATIPAGEQNKTLATVERLYHQAVSGKMDRKSVVVALGGGVVGDLAGFVAATYQRGIGFVQMPTSLLGMVDSSVGGKVGVDLPEGKNLVGAFYQPQLVLTNLAWLGTLPEREWKCGMAEVVKYGMIMDEPFFARLESQAGALLAHKPAALEEVVSRCCRLKGDVVEQDEKESGLREILNYGHTFGHALETLGGYSVLSHGEAVAIGMRMAARTAVLLGRIGPEAEARQEALLRKFGLGTVPVELKEITAAHLLMTMRLDKKSRSGKLRLVLPSRVGHCETVEIAQETVVLQAIETILS